MCFTCVIREAVRCMREREMELLATDPNPKIWLRHAKGSFERHIALHADFNYAYCGDTLMGPRREWIESPLLSLPSGVCARCTGVYLAMEQVIKEKTL